MKEYTIFEVISNVKAMPDGWFYLPPKNWTLETKGAFSLDSRDFPPGSTDYLPSQVKTYGWVEVIDTPTIEDIVSNVDQQLINATIDDYFRAFKFYYENDAFLIF
jgi:hypothetical protein